MRSIGFASFVLVAFFIYGFYINQFDISQVPGKLGHANSQQLNDYRGVLNVHTDLSSGSAPASFVIASAKLANLDFLVFTDLNTFNTPTAFEAYHGNLLVISAGKYSYIDSRIIFYSLKNKHIGNNLGDAQVKLADILSQNISANIENLTVLAHPYKAGYSWSGNLPSGLDGFEILNLKSLVNRAWGNSKLSTIWSLIIYPFNPRLAFLRLFSEPTEELALLDKETESRKIVAFAGTEASARAIPLANFLMRFPSYKRSFEFMSNHLLLKSELTGSFNSDRIKIFNALKNGNFYMAIDILGDTKGFSTTVEDESKTYLMGSNVKLNKNTTLNISLPSKPKDFFEIVIFKNGKPVQKYNDVKLVHPITEPGVYRVQVRLRPVLPLPEPGKWITWIYTNPFFISK